MNYKIWIKARSLIFKIIFYSILFIFQCSCEKKNSTPNPDNLPSITTKGLNIFGCLLDGVVFTNQTIPSNPRISYSLHFTKDSIYHFNFEADYDAATGTPIFINILGSDLPLKTGDKIPFSAYTYLNSGPRHGISGEIGYNGIFFTQSPSNGELDVVLNDTTNRILSCTFHFDAFSGPNTKVSLTNGRFDCKY